TGFENEALIFPAVHHAFKFCTLTITGRAAMVAQADFAFFCRYFDHVREPQRRFVLTREDISLINPNTRTSPIFRTRADAELTKRIYRRVPVLTDEQTGTGAWGISFLRMIDMANDSGLFKAKPDDHSLPLYEAKMIWQYNHRFGNYEGRAERGFTNLEPVSGAQVTDPSWQPIPFYWISELDVLKRLVPLRKEEQDMLDGMFEDEQLEFLRPRASRWLTGFRDVTNATKERRGNNFPDSRSFCQGFQGE
ncbi:MAG: hypothetical protein FJY85_20560, partial [Deltaproteobacteria bacterium]|nr:hypothetical protein [Deltaproteobacteria bacterium]